MTRDAQERLARASRWLEPEHAGELLSAAASAADAEVVAWKLRSVHERPGRSRSHVHDARIRVGDVERDVLLVAHVDARRIPRNAFVLARGPDRVAVWRFPHDPYLPGLPSAVDPSRVRELLDQLQVAPGEVGIHTRAYRPSRRAVVETRIHGGEVAGRVLYLKVLAGDRAAELAAVHRSLRAFAPVPRVVGLAPAQGILALEALSGRTLRQAIVDGVAVPDPGELVELSRRLASSGFAGDRDPRAFADPTRHVDTLVRLVPDRSEDVRRVAAAAARLRGQRVGVHGDLHDGQLLLDEAGAVTGLLDVDGAGQGLLAQDAGSLVAHLEAVGEVWPDRAPVTSAYSGEVAAAYREVVGPEALAQATAGAWLGLATGPHRAQDDDWEGRTQRRIDRAVQVLDG